MLTIMAKIETLEKWREEIVDNVSKLRREIKKLQKEEWQKQAEYEVKLSVYEEIGKEHYQEAIKVLADELEGMKRKIEQKQKELHDYENCIDKILSVIDKRLKLYRIEAFGSTVLSFK